MASTHSLVFKCLRVWRLRWPSPQLQAAVRALPALLSTPLCHWARASTAALRGNRGCGELAITRDVASNSRELVFSINYTW